VRQQPISGGHLQTPPITGTHVYGFHAATRRVSENGGILHAYDASNVARELYNISNQTGTRD